LKNDEESNTYHDIIGNGYNLENDAIIRETAHYVENNIDPDILEMIKMKSKNNTLAEIGKKFGLSGERVRQKIVSVRKQLENTGWEAFS
jgi:DNA-directed RNA polymerase sigma subunit (sigma70/sigma32)